MKVLFISHLKLTFYSVTIDLSMCQVYFTKKKGDFFFGDALEFTMNFML